LIAENLAPIVAQLTTAQRASFQQRLCELILCAPEIGALQESTANYETLLLDQLDRGFPLPPGGGFAGAGPLDGPCEQCLRRTGFLLPEFEIVHDRHGFTPRAVPLPLSRTWESLGPTNLAGCMLDVSIDPADPHRLYAASANGGIWRLTFNPSYSQYTWDPLTDEHPSLQATNVAVAPSNFRMLYWVDSGNVLWVSGNAGAGWRNVIVSLNGVYRMVVHPSNPDRVLVATTNGLWAVDAATNHATQLRMGDTTDVALDPGDPAIIYVGVRNGGIDRFDPQAGTWTRLLTVAQAEALSVGSLQGLIVKIAVGAQGTTTTRRLAIKFGPREIAPSGVSTPAMNFAEVFVSGRPGTTGWVRSITPALGLWQQGDWVNVIAIDPNNDNIMLVGGERLIRTTNGGQTWTTSMLYRYESALGHEDQHRIVFDPANSGVVYLANDGGIYRSVDSGATWQDLNSNLVTMQFYHFGITSSRAVSNAYHWGELAAPLVASRQWVQIDGGAWEFKPVHGDPKRPDYFYYFTGNIIRRQFTATGAAGWDDYVSFACNGWPAFDTRPLSNLVFVGAQDPVSQEGVIYRAPNGEQGNPSWTRDAIAANVGLAQDPIVRVVFANAEPTRAYALSSKGVVLVRDDVDNVNGRWRKVGHLPAGVSPIEIDTNVFDEQRLYVISDGGLYKSTDAGATWQQVAGQAGSPIPAGRFRAVVASPRSLLDLFLGTYAGVFYSPDEGLTWYPIHDGLPNALIYEMHWLGDYLYVATHGRGLWRHKPYP
jgi:photosystem II stability/assembly factor-like uncharacterized protein